MDKGRVVKKLAIGMLALAFLGVNIKTMAEQAAETRKLSILSVKGENGSVIKGGVREIRAAAGMRLGQGAKVKTGAATQIYLEADQDKVMKLDSSSVAEITGASSKKLKITLKSGSLFFNVERKLAEDEELTFDAAQTSMSIRGTGGAISFEEGNLVLSLAEGSVDWKIGNETVHVEAGEQVTLCQVKDGESLEQNGMNSIYELLEKKEFGWKELDAFVLETMLELVEEGRLDPSAIGYNPASDRKEALELLEQKKEEKRLEENQKQEEAKKKKEEKESSKESQTGRQDGRPPKDKEESSGGGSSVRETEEETKGEADSTGSSFTEPPTSESPEEETEPPTSESPEEETEPPTSGSTGDSTEPPTSGSTGDSTEPPASGSTGDSTEPPASGSTGDSTEPPASGSTGDSTEPPASGSTGDSTEPPASGSSGGSTEPSIKNISRDSKSLSAGEGANLLPKNETVRESQKALIPTP